jgi:hypothetical protein
MANFYEIDETVFDTVPVYGTAGQSVNAAAPKTGATITLRDSGTTNARTAYDAPSGSVLSSLTTVNGRIQGPTGQHVFVSGETPVDIVVNLGLPNAFTLRWSPPQLGAAGPTGPPGPTGGMVVAATVGDGVADDTAAIIAALAALPAYGSGIGGGTVIIPTTPTNICKVSSAISLTSGQRIVGGSMTGPLIRGSFAGPLFTSASDGGTNPLANFVAMERLSLQNTSSNSAARAFEFHQIGNLYLHRVNANGSAAGGFIGHCRACILLHVDDIRTGGAGAAACEAGLLVDEASNMARLLNSSYTDSKGGLRWLGSLGGRADGNHFEALAGGSAFDAALAFSALRGVKLGTNYFESCTCSAITGFSATGASDAVEIGTQYIFNCKSPFIDLAGVGNARVAASHMEPGAIAPNANGVSNLGTLAATNSIAQQSLVSGTGVPVNPSLFLDLVGTGSPEGVVTAAVGSRYARLDGGASTSLYVKTSGSGNTGWTAK